MSGAKKTTSRAKKGQPAAEVVLNVVKDIGEGTTIADIKAQTGYDDKKIRNIVHRLSKEGKIKRKKRGLLRHHNRFTDSYPLSSRSAKALPG